MKMIVRITGTWLLGLALVLVIVDIAKSVAQSELLITSLGGLWQALNTISYAAAYEALKTQLLNAGIGELADALFSIPAWGLFFVLGAVLLVLGKGPQGDKFVNTH